MPYMQLMFDQLNDAVFVVDRMGNILMINQAACKLTGYDQAELLGTPVGAIVLGHADVSSAEVRKKVSQRNHRQNPTSGSLHTEIHSKSGRKTPIEVTHLHFPELEGNISVIIARNLSALQTAQKLQEMSISLSSSLNLTEVFDLLLVELKKLIPYDGANFMIVEGRNVHIARSMGYDAFDQSLSSLVDTLEFDSNSHENIRRIIGDRQPLILKDTHDVPYWIETAASKYFKSWAGVPIVINDKVEAIIAMDKVEPNFFTDEHTSVLMVFSSQAASAIKNARLYEEELKRIRQLDGLQTTLAAITSQFDLNLLLKEIVSQAIALLNAANGALALYEANLEKLKVIVTQNLPHDYAGHLLDLETGLMGRVAASKKAMKMDRFIEKSILLDTRREKGSHSGMAVPLMTGEKLIGVLGIGMPDSGKVISESKIDLLNTFAQQATIAIENARLYNETAKSADRFRTLYHLSQIISTNLQPEEIYPAIHHAVSELMVTEFFCISLFDAESNTVTDVYMDDKGEPQPLGTRKLEKGLFYKAIKSGTSLLYRTFDNSTMEELGAVLVGDTSNEELSQSILVVPLKIGARCIGVLSAQSYQPRMYSNSDREMLELLATNVAIAVENARLFDEVQKLASMDSLTQLYNRRKFEELAKVEFERSRRYHRPLCAVMIDLDQFKLVNDTYGHIVGDQALAAVASLCKKNLRSLDILARFGGEEFILLLPETCLTEALTTAQRLRYECEAEEFNTTRGVISLSISLGLIELDDSCTSLEELINRADQALYASKHAGRNVCTVWTPELAKTFPPISRTSIDH